MKRLHDRYVPLEDYAVIGDCYSAALIDKEGSIDFLCVPDFDSPTIFGALLDRDNGGVFEIGPTSEDYRFKQMYLPDTNVLITRFLSPDGVGEVTDFMLAGPGRHAMCVVRRVRCVRGPFTFRLNCAPRFDYARTGHTVKTVDGGSYFVADDAQMPVLRLMSPVEVTIDDRDVCAEFTLQAGETRDFVLEVVAGPDSRTQADHPGWVDRAYDSTVGYWRRWVAQTSYRGRWKEMLDRSALTLKMLTSQRYGSIVAAPTFGLPELVGGERNWDYRYTWIRDGSMTAAAFIRLGFHAEATAFVQWITRRFEDSGGAALQIMYGIDGRVELTESTLDHLEGYRKSAPVRIGNAAYRQRQLDIFGELLLTIELYDEQVEPVSYDLWLYLRGWLGWLAANWQLPDEGIWEVRGGEQEFLFSRVMCWVAFDRALRLAERRSLPAPVEEWRTIRNQIHEDVYTGFWSPAQGAFVQFRGSTTLDAACLLMPAVGFISSRDQRWLATLRRLEEELVDDSLVYRYRTGDAACDGLTGSEGTFCMCSFWFAESLARAGHGERARLLLENILSYANHLGLFPEEMDRIGNYLGNFPQAFTHLGLINTVLSLEEATPSRNLGE